MSLRETLQTIYANSERQFAEAELDWWCGWAARSRLSPFRHLAKTVPRHAFSWERGRFSGALFRGNWRVGYGVI